MDKRKVNVEDIAEDFKKVMRQAEIDAGEERPLKIHFTSIDELKDKFNVLLEDIEKFFRERLKKFFEELISGKEEKTVEEYLEETVENLEPTTHCCECTPGKHFERHMVHIQYPKCNCKKEGFVLKR